MPGTGSLCEADITGSVRWQDLVSFTSDRLRKKKDLVSIYIGQIKRVHWDNTPGSTNVYRGKIAFRRIKSKKTGTAINTDGVFPGYYILKMKSQ